MFLYFGIYVSIYVYYIFKHCKIDRSGEELADKCNLIIFNYVNTLISWCEW